jgi:(2Fe-2S) ferredoxin
MGQFEKHVFVCTSGSWCADKDGDGLGVHGYLKKRVKEAGLGERVRINHSGCLDQCGNGPMIVVYPENVWYSGVTVDDARAIFEEHLLGGKPVERLLYRPAKPGKNKLPRDEHERPIGRPERQIIIRKDTVKAQ